MSIMDTLTEDFDGDDKQSTGDGRSSSSGTSIPEIPEGVANLIFDAIRAMESNNRPAAVEIPAFSDDAPELRDEYREEYEGLDDVDTLSAEDLFDRDWGDYDLVMEAPVTNSDNVSEEEMERYEDTELYKDGGDGDMKAYVVHPDFVEEVRGMKNNKSASTPISKAINGYFADEIVDNWGEKAYISVGKGKKANSDELLGNLKKIRLSVSETDNRPKDRREAQVEVGELEQEEYEEWCEENGFDA